MKIQSRLKTAIARAEGVVGDLLAAVQSAPDAQARQAAFATHAAKLDMPLYLTDEQGFLLWYNPAAERLWGWPPPLGRQRWCGSWRLFRMDGAALPLDECPMAAAMLSNRRLRGGQALSERPDHTRVAFRPFPTPVHDSAGRLVAGINLLLEIPEALAAEAQLKTLSVRLDRLLAGLSPTLSDAALLALAHEIENVSAAIAKLAC